MIWLLLAAAALAVAPGRRRPAQRLGSTNLPDEPGNAATENTDVLASAAAMDLFAACLRAGMPVSAAAAATAPGAPRALSDFLRKAAELLALGGDPGDAWTYSGDDSPTEELARVARRSARSGTALSSAVAEIAAHTRDDAEDAATAAAERAGVLISGPLGVCFLPAFLCLGIVPVVIGLAGSVLGGGLL
ncbi:type II secretion system F family protein [Rhodococcus sp. HNM0569]|uniref:type II secretion system F family protein n=1 Tax=Rhodococcus sp. HNM0569 TaxID=2716340 RepID=UPI003211ECE8